MHKRSDLGLVTAQILAGVERLWTQNHLAINGQRIEPTCWFDGTGLDDTAKTWTCRDTATALSESGSGTSPSLYEPAPFLDEKLAEFAGGKYLDASGNSFADVTTEDWVLEVLFEAVASKTLLSKYHVASTTGYQLDIGATCALVLTIGDPTGTVAVSSAAVASESLNHAICFLDRSGSAQWYVNGAASGSAVVISGRPGTLTSAVPFTVGANTAGTGQFTKRVAHIALWKSASWLDTHLQSTVARERAALVMGHQALHNHDALTPSTL